MSVRDLKMITSAYEWIDWHPVSADDLAWMNDDGEAQ